MRQWYLWALWLLSLAACPISLLAVSLSYPHVAPHPPPWPPNPPPQRLVENLLMGHALLSLAAAVAVPVLVRHWPGRVATWVGVAVWMGVIALLSLGIVWDKTGKYL